MCMLGVRLCVCLWVCGTVSVREHNFSNHVSSRHTLYEMCTFVYIFCGLTAELLRTHLGISELQIVPLGVVELDDQRVFVEEMNWVV